MHIMYFETVPKHSVSSNSFKICKITVVNSCNYYIFYYAGIKIDTSV